MIIFLSGRIVIKYGTNALLERDSVRLSRQRIREIASIVNQLYVSGIEVILVSSGAVAAGMEMNGLTERPQDIDEIKDLAAEGQVYLMREYAAAFKEHNLGVYQLLVFQYTFREKERREAVKRVEGSFMKRKVAIFNTNDALLSDLVDNDPLAADIARYCNAQSLIMISESGNLGSGGASSKEKALRMAKKQGIEAAVMTHAELDELIIKWQR